MVVPVLIRFRNTSSCFALLTLRVRAVAPFENDPGK